MRGVQFTVAVTTRAMQKRWQCIHMRRMQRTKRGAWGCCRVYCLLGTRLVLRILPSNSWLLMVGTSAKPPAYDAGWSPEFQHAADLALVVEGKEVPVHSQMMARESQARREGSAAGNVGRARSRLVAPHRRRHL